MCQFYSQAAGAKIVLAHSRTWCASSMRDVPALNTEGRLTDCEAAFGEPRLGDRDSNPD